MKRESTVVELNETPRSSGRQKERKSRDRVFIRAATVEKRENDSQCRSTRSTFTRCDGEERKRFRLKWFRDGSKSWSEKKKFFSLSEKYWGIKILQCVCMYASFLKYYSFDNTIQIQILCIDAQCCEWNKYSCDKWNENLMCKNKRYWTL